MKFHNKIGHLVKNSSYDFLVDNSSSNSGLVTLVLGPDGGSVVQVVYSDESGTGSRKDELVVVVAGLMLNVDSQWHPVLQSIESAAAEYLGGEKVSRYEIKGSHLYGKIRKGDAGAEKFLAALVSIPSRHRVPVFYGAVDRAGFKHVQILEGEQNKSLSPAGAFREALTDCLFQVETYANTFVPKEQILWIHDNGTYNDQAKKSLKETRDIINESSWSDRQTILGIAPYPVTHVVDTIYFGNSHESRAIQLADVCCSTIVRHLRGDPITAPYYDLLRRQIITGDRRPRYEGSEQMWSTLRR
jgi:hypothetical protein